jgi:hypothetical protein
MHRKVIPDKVTGIGRGCRTSSRSAFNRCPWRLRAVRCLVRDRLWLAYAAFWRGIFPNVKVRKTDARSRSRRMIPIRRCKKTRLRRSKDVVVGKAHSGPGCQIPEVACSRRESGGECS